MWILAFKPIIGMLQSVSLPRLSNKEQLGRKGAYKDWKTKYIVMGRQSRN